MVETALRPSPSSALTTHALCHRFPSPSPPTGPSLWKFGTEKQLGTGPFSPLKVAHFLTLKPPSLRPISKESNRPSNGSGAASIASRPSPPSPSQVRNGSGYNGWMHRAMHSLLDSDEPKPTRRPSPSPAPPAAPPASSPSPSAGPCVSGEDLFRAGARGRSLALGRELVQFGDDSDASLRSSCHQGHLTALE
jgi:hypothetical protein